MTFVNRRSALRLQHLRVQHARPLASRLIRIHLQPAVLSRRDAFILGVLLLDVAETLASAKLAQLVLSALAPASETSLGRFDTFSQDHVIYEAEVGGQGGVVDLVDDGDGVVLVSGEAADLTQVAVLLFLFQTLKSELEYYRPLNILKSHLPARRGERNASS